ncbi:sialic acid-binding Ig-like lectin 10 [Scomber scombrus]|uniref:sialic acid-binding Ig-like lectin 10 n=1 Tax=Scomber scombrus TaxID=13677 RepID=UPI002DD9260B|nr:sialic acid-binding Ig-like lectin 10 [Scomber scombrus]
MSVSPSGPVPENSDVTLTCSSDAKPAVRNYTWYSAYGGQETFMGTGPSLKIQAPKTSFFCKAENNLGAGRSNISQIDVQYPPEILPSSDCAKPAGQIKCSCETVGNPSPTLNWYLDGLPVNHSDKFTISSQSVNGTGLRSIMIVNHLQEKDLLTVVCSSTNSLGSASQKFCVHGAEHQTSQGPGMLPVFITTIFALLLLVCYLLWVIRTQKTRLNPPNSQCKGDTSTVAMNQLPTSDTSTVAMNQLPTSETSTVAMNQLPTSDTSTVAMNQLPTSDTSTVAMNQLPTSDTSTVAMNQLPTSETSTVAMNQLPTSDTSTVAMNQLPTSDTSSVAMNQLPTNGERDEIPNTTEEDIYANSSVMRQANTTISETNNTNSPGSEPENADGDFKSSKEKEEGSNVIYSSVNWKSKKKKGKDSGDMDQPGSSYLEEERCTAGAMRRNVVSNAVEMESLYAEPKLVKKEVECEYAQVKFKDKNAMHK